MIRRKVDSVSFQLYSDLRKTVLIVFVILILCFLVLPADAIKYENKADLYISSAADAQGGDFTDSKELAEKYDEIFRGDIGIYNRKDTSDAYKVLAPLGPIDPISQTRYIKISNTGTWTWGSTCWVYANGVYNTLFGDVPGSYGSTPMKNSEVISSSFSPNTGKEMYDKFVSLDIKSGAYIAGYNHYYIVLDYDENYIWILDGNSDQADYIRRIQIGKYSWDKVVNENRYSSIRFIVQPKDEYYASNYPTCLHNNELYTNTGKCEQCGYQLPYDNAFDGSVAGTYRTTAMIDGYSGPYDSMGILCFPKGEEIQIIGKVVNADSKTFYKLSSGLYVKNSGLTLVSQSSDLKVDPCASITLNKGGYCPLTGSIQSNRPIEWVRAYLDGKEYAYFKPNSTFVKLSGSPADDQLIGRNLSVGSHTVVIEASDGVMQASKTVNITVNNVSAPTAPKITAQDIVGGKRITITQTTSGSTLYYYYYACGGSNRSTTSNSVSFDIDRDATVAAYSTKNGRMGTRVEQQFFVNTLSEPTIDVQYTSSGANVVIKTSDSSAEIYYSTDGQSFSRYYGTINVTANCTVYAYAQRNGYVTSGRASATVNVQPPETPSATRYNTEAKIAQGNTASVSWDKDSRALNYTVRLYKDGEVVDSKVTAGLYAAFVLSDAGEYYITVQAHNSVGDSQESAAVTVTSMPPVTVTFVDYDDSVISVQSVKYGEDASRPTAPNRKGYTFDGWSRSYEKVTEDITVKAEYTINTYTVRFYDVNGESLIGSQDIVYGNSVDLSGPSANVTLEAGYCLAGWRIEDADEDSDMDYSKVDSDMRLVAVTMWENQNLPIVITDVDAVWSTEGTGYDVSATLNVANEEVLNSNTRVVKIVAAAKSSEDKLLGIEVISLNVGSSTIGGEHDLFITCSDSALADSIEVNILGSTENGRTGTVLAEEYSVAPTLNDNGTYWTPWSTTKPNVDESLIQTKTEYRYRDNTKSTTTVTTGSAAAPSMDGWTHNGYTTSWGPTIYNGTSYIASNANRNVWTESELIQNGYTQYNYYGYRRTTLDSNGKRWYHYCYDTGRATHGGTWELIQTGWLNNPLTASSSRSGTHTAGHSSSCACTITGNVYKYNYNGRIYYWCQTREIAPVYKTHYYYQNMQYTHNFYRWTPGAWSDWGDTVYTAVPGSRDVETRTVYRYYTNEEAAEDTSGETRIISGALDSSLGDLSGKVATIMVYKEMNTDPTQAQMEYVGQVTIGEGNTYSVTCKMREEPSSQSGNFITSVALEGTTNLLNVGVIYAPEEECTVKFIGADGEELKTEVLYKGEDATPPEAPIREGYRFVSWSQSTSNIQKNVDIVAEYEAETYAIAFVDWNNDTISLRTARHGETLTAPEAPSSEGYEFLYWDAFKDTDNLVVTESMVISAVYEPDVFTIRFHRQDDTILSEQQVQFGQSAQLPDYPETEGMVFLGWSTDVEWWNATADTDVYPILVYSETAVVPISSLGSEYTGKDATLEFTAGEGATIYYTTDGSDPTSNGIEYTGPIELTETSTILAVAVEEGKNTSDIIEVFFEQTDEFYYDDTPELVMLGEYSVAAQPGQEIDLRISLDENPGLIGYLFTVETDTDVFYVDYDIESGFDCIAGDASGNGTMICAPYEYSGWQVLWYSPDAVYESGVLFTMTLKVSEEAEAGVYPVKVYYSPSNTMSGEFFEETDLSNALISIDSDSSVLIGDVNCDGQITTSDVILTARQIVGLVKISEQQQTLADVNGDDKITNADVILLARYILGLATLG